MTARPLQLGSLITVPASQRPDLIAAPTLDLLTRQGWLDQVGVVEIDPALSDTAAGKDAYALPPETLANCVVVGGKREGRSGWPRASCCLRPEPTSTVWSSGGSMCARPPSCPWSGRWS